MSSNHLILCCPLLLPPSIFPSIRVFSMSQFFTSGGQSFGVSASASVFLMNIQDWLPLGWNAWISLQSKGLSRVLSTTAQFSSFQSLSRVQLFATPWITARQASLSITNPRVYSNSCPSSLWCHPAISSSVIPFSTCPQSLPASESFPMSQLFTWGGQSIKHQFFSSQLPL